MWAGLSRILRVPPVSRIESSPDVAFRITAESRFQINLKSRFCRSARNPKVPEVEAVAGAGCKTGGGEATTGGRDLAANRPVTAMTKEAITTTAAREPQTTILKDLLR